MSLRVLTLPQALLLSLTLVACTHAPVTETPAPVAATEPAPAVPAVAAEEPSRAPASFEEPMPAQETAAGEPEFTDEFENAFAATTSERQPASIARKAQHGRRSRIPASVSDGFELRVLYNKETSMFWVVKRDVRYDLIYANSVGSKSTVSLSPEVFHQLQNVAQSFKPGDTDLRRCKEASIQLSVVATGRNERTTSSCVNAKGADAERLRNFSQSLAAVVR